MRKIVAPKRRMHRCRSCDARRPLPKHVDEYGDAKPICLECGGSLRLDKWADDRKWRSSTCYCLDYPYPHHRDGGHCYATEREKILADQVDNAPPHVLDAVFD